MNRRITVLAVLLALAVFVTVHGAFSQTDSTSKRRVINLPDKPVQAPFSNAILTGDTLYIAGSIGLDAKTGKAPEKIEDEIKLLGKRDKWIFAAARDARGAAILIVAGFHDRESSAENSVECDFGTVLKMDASGLHLLGASDYLFGKNAPIDATVVDALMRDASVRYTRAFGGASGFSRLIGAQGLTREQVPAPLLPHLAEQGVKFGAPELAARRAPVAH